MSKAAEFFKELAKTLYPACPVARVVYTTSARWHLLPPVRLFAGEMAETITVDPELTCDVILNGKHIKIRLGYTRRAETLVVFAPAPLPSIGGQTWEL